MRYPDKINGIAKTFYSDGSLKSESTYLNNELNGEEKSYYNSKILKTKGFSLLG